MTEREFLERMDRRMDETAEHIAETKVHIAETKVHIAETKDLIEGLKIDMRQREERWVKVYRENSKILHELVAESRAHRQALLALIDEMKGPPPSAA